MVLGSWEQVLVIVAAVVPGFVYQISRRRVLGPDPDEADVTVRMLRAIASSAIFACLYAILFGSLAERLLQKTTGSAVEVAVSSLPTLAIWVLALALLVPWVAARAIFYITTSRGWLTATGSLRARLGLRHQWDPTPSAWDFAFSHREAGWVRVLTSGGLWLGGYFGTESFASSYPDPRDLFIEVGYAMSPEGALTDRVSAPGGLYVRCDDIVLVDFIPATGDTEDLEISETAERDTSVAGVAEEAR